MHVVEGRSGVSVRFFPQKKRKKKKIPRHPQRCVEGDLHIYGGIQILIQKHADRSPEKNDNDPTCISCDVSCTYSPMEMPSDCFFKTYYPPGPFLKYRFLGR